MRIFRCVLMPQCASLICLWPNNDWSENNLIYIKKKISRVIRIDPFSWHKRPTSFLCWNFCFKVHFLAWCWSNNLHELFIFFADVYLNSLDNLFLKYYSPTVTHDITFVYNFCVLWWLLRVYLQNAEVINKSFIICNGRWIVL